MLDLSMLLDSARVPPAQALGWHAGRLGFERLRAASEAIEVDQAGDEISGKVVGDEGRVADRDQQLLLPAHGDVQAVVQAQVTEEAAVPAEHGPGRGASSSAARF